MRNNPLIRAIFTIFIVVMLSSSIVDARSKCEAREELVMSSPAVRPSWTEKASYNDVDKEYFVGLSSQNKRIEDGVNVATEQANIALIENVGEVVQKKSEGVLTIDAEDVRDSFGSRAMTAYFKHKKREAVYYEKWANFENCRRANYYNVWVLVSVPRSELAKEADKATVYLLDLQEKENASGATGLLPSLEVTHIASRPQNVADAPQKDSSASQPIDAEPSQMSRTFNCSNVSFTGGPNFQLGGQMTNRGKFDKWGYNIFLMGEGGLTKNICAGGGVGFSTLRMQNGGTGNIIPFPFRLTAHFPIGEMCPVVFWFGGDVGVAVIYGFDTEMRVNRMTGELASKKKAGAALWLAAMAGIDIRLQRSLYLSLGGGYVSFIGDRSFQFFSGNAGIKYRF